jgi:hypothetical protein
MEHGQTGPGIVQPRPRRPFSGYQFVQVFRRKVETAIPGYRRPLIEVESGKGLRRAQRFGGRIAKYVFPQIRDTSLPGIKSDTHCILTRVSYFDYGDHVCSYASGEIFQNAFGNPAWRRTALAVWRDLIVESKGKRLSLIGELQISRSPLP